MGTNCAPLVADLFQFCYERYFMMSLSDDKQVDVICAFNKVANRDWVDHQACSLLQYINVIANLFIMENYFNELR